MITTEQATVYRGGGRRWFTLSGAVKAEAISIIKRKYPSVRMQCPEDDGFHWRSIERSNVLLRRVSRIVKQKMGVKDE
jgi:hypothetical protein